MKFDKDLVARLEEYWDKRNNNCYYRIGVEVNEDNIKVKRYDGYGFPGMLKTVYNNEEFKKYIDKI